MGVFAIDGRRLANFGARHALVAASWTQNQSGLNAKSTWPEGRLKASLPTLSHSSPANTETATEQPLNPLKPQPNLETQEFMP